MRTIPPSDGVLQANCTLCLWNVNVTPRCPAMGEADEPRLHQLLMHFREERNRDRAWSRATARTKEPIILPRVLGTGKCACLQPDARDGQECTAVNSGSDLRGQSRRIFILRGKLPIPRCCDRHLILYRCTERNARQTVRRYSRITGEPHRTVAAGGVKCPWGLARRKGSHCNPQIAQSTSRWFSDRGNS